MTKSKYINSPSWREGGSNIAVLVLVALFLFGLMVAAFLLTGGDI